MLKSASVLAAAVLAAAGLAGAAQAASISPAGASFSLVGPLQLSQSTTVVCDVTLSGSVDPSGGFATITGGAFAPGDWQCGWLVVPSSFPWTVTPTGGGASGTELRIDGIGANSILGNCAGTVFVDWQNAPPSPSGATFVNATIPGSPGTCYITGRLDSYPDLTVTP
ncbi:protein activator of alkane oxidation PraB [Caulobacter endophyticus]|uniref:protein activator of alkane oxidation PraB n=1 Tax=Caulobacter endophyticus TaxID=2172652 RepID=UPI00240F986B|nr:protein activator of alkane oxidation PraB [Caulobacter endophyticus]MDG2530939.1 protein activator of alkane oxidation PraB [Caulobacter endophyticus]